MKLTENRWPIIIAGLLSLHVVTCLFFVYLVTRDPSLAVEDDYYQKALQWDQHKAQLANNVALGWQARITAEPARAPGSPTQIRVTLTSKTGEPVDGVSLKGEAFAITRSADVKPLTLHRSGPGVYEGQLDAQRGGLWELRLVALRSTDRFTVTERVSLPSRARTGASS